jgi:lysophospholipase L1-like esterase
MENAKEKKLVALLASTTVALLAAAAFLLIRARAAPHSFNTQAALADPALRAELVAQLANNASGIWDSHNDPEVGRVMLPNLKDMMGTGVPNQTNALGLRERYFQLPKPKGLLRVVVLGDSFVQGFGVEAKDRMGVLLERYLVEHTTGWKGQIECLHIGVGGWNTVSECAYLRRMLTDLAPDLVLHVLVTNDLDDEQGVRGFGGLAAFAPLEPSHADALVYHAFPTKFSTPRNTNYLLMGLDYESRHRFEETAAAIGRLVPLIRQSGARYVLVSYWVNNNLRLWSFLQQFLEQKEFASLPVRLYTDPTMTLSPSDGHWSPKGHELVAQLLFALIRQRELLPELALTPWPGVEEARVAELEEAWGKEQKEWSGRKKRTMWAPPAEILSSLDTAHFTDLEWRHVYTGLDEKGQVSPFASFCLSRHGQATLRIRGRALPRPELAGARMRASVEGIQVGEHELVPGEPFEVRYPLPAEVDAERAVAVRLETNDYGYTGQDLQHCISFVLEQLALE